MQQIDGALKAPGRRFALVVSTYHDFVTDRLQAGALEALAAADVDSDDVTAVKVPGAFEIPVAARALAATGRFDAVVGLGCLIRGGTPHFEFIASAVAQGLIDVSRTTGVPVTFGVLTTNSVEEAVERAGSGAANKGWEAAMAAVGMATLLPRLRAAEASGIRA